MIVKLKGKVELLEPNIVYLNVSNITYEVLIHLKTYLKLKESVESEDKEIFIYHLISEKSQKLYGFLNQKEKDFFKLIISFNGIGEVMAMKILSFYNVGEIFSIIESGNAKSFEKIPKIKEKTSSKIFFEFKQKLDKIEKFINKEELANEVQDIKHYQIKNTVVSALIQLGLDEKTANQKFNLTYKQNPNLEKVDEIIKISLNL